LCQEAAGKTPAIAADVYCFNAYDLSFLNGKS